MAKCNLCNQKIDFCYDSSRQKWIKVEPYEKDASERMSRRNKIPIPFNPNIHNRHLCPVKQNYNYDSVYRG